MKILLCAHAITCALSIMLNREGPGLISGLSTKWNVWAGIHKPCRLVPSVADLSCSEVGRVVQNTVKEGAKIQIVTIIMGFICKLLSRTCYLSVWSLPYTYITEILQCTYGSLHVAFLSSADRQERLIILVLV